MSDMDRPHAPWKLIAAVGLALLVAASLSITGVLRAQAGSVGPPGPFLADVSCQSTTSCVAVGGFVNESGATADLAETWDGAWKVVLVPDPADADTASLWGVACYDAGACIAVGGASDGAGHGFAFSELLRGSKWVIKVVPLPVGTTYASLQRVACASASDCVAVGASDGRPLAERWNGTRWSVMNTPDVGPGGSALSAVSCTGNGTCMAAGSRTDSGGTQVTLAEKWDGSSWSMSPSVNPSGSVGSSLDGVSCTSPTSCIAVGSSVASGGPYLALAEHWDGSGWTLMTTANPDGTSVNQLGDISCATDASCIAVGWDNASGSYASETLAERWDGSSWTLMTVPSGPGSTVLTALSCTPPACMAVGSTDDKVGRPKPFSETWSGTQWSVAHTPDAHGRPSERLVGVSCTSATACMAVGSGCSSASACGARAARWDGTSWSGVGTAKLAHHADAEMTAVSCADASDCVAVGSSSLSGDESTLAEEWNGSSWTQLGPSSPHGSSSVFFDQFDSISCFSTTECMAVGSWTGDANGDAESLAESWVNGAWTILNAPMPAGSFTATLYGVSCPGASLCMAVGSASTSNGIVDIADQWNGTAWQSVSIPTPSGDGGALNAVSCVSATSCVAVGTEDAGATSGTVTETWDGSSWSIMPSPNAAGSTGDELLSVSCVIATHCTASGTSWSDSHPPATGGDVTLVEQWDGSSWSLVSTPNAPKSSGDVLAGLSCSAASSCAAVGMDVNGQYNVVSLGERLSGTSWLIAATPDT
jgi:hypothetical protein